MSRTVYCKKLNKEAQGLTTAPYPGQLGQKIYDTISVEAWTLWVAHQTTLINEYRLNLTEAASRDFLKTEMEKFLFGQGSDKPSGYQTPEEK